MARDSVKNGLVVFIAWCEKPSVFVLLAFSHAFSLRAQMQILLHIVKPVSVSVLVWVMENLDGKTWYTDVTYPMCCSRELGSLRLNLKSLIGIYIISVLTVNIFILWSNDSDFKYPLHPHLSLLL